MATLGYNPRAGQGMRQFLQDLPYALRQLTIHRGVTLAAIVSLAVGIAAVATTFTWIDRLLLRPLPGVRHTTGLRVLLVRTRDGVSTSLSFPEYRELDQAIRPAGTVAATGFSSFAVSKQRGDEPERLFGELVSAGWVRGVPRGAPAVAVAHELVKAMSSPTLVDRAQLPSWDSCVDRLAHVYLSSLSIVPESGAPRTRDTVG